MPQAVKAAIDEISRLRIRLAEAEAKLAASELKREHLTANYRSYREEAEHRTAKLREALEVISIVPPSVQEAGHANTSDYFRLIDAAREALASDLTGSGDTGEPKTITAKDSDIFCGPISCPHCKSLFSFAKPVDGSCPWCKRLVVGDTGEQGEQGGKG